MAILSCSISKPVHPSARQKTEVKRHTLTSFENDSFFFSFFQILELMKVLLFYPHKFSTLQTKLAGKSRAMQNTGHFFSLLQLQNTVGQEENTSYLLSPA